MISRKMAKREQEGPSGLLAFALVCKEWRKAQLKVGGPLRSRVMSDVLLPGRVPLAKWALADGCPRDDDGYDTMASGAAAFGHLELVQWLALKGGFKMDHVLRSAVLSGNLELVKWLRRAGCQYWNTIQDDACSLAAGKGHLEVLQWLRATDGCPWDYKTCAYAAFSHERGVLRWARENGCPWNAYTRNWAERELGYTDGLGNLVEA